MCRKPTAGYRDGRPCRQGERWPVQVRGSLSREAARRPSGRAGRCRGCSASRRSASVRRRPALWR